MTARGYSLALHVYVSAVSAAGLLLMVVLTMRSRGHMVHHDPGVAWLLATLVLVTELFPLQLGKRAEAPALTMSAPFDFALLLGWGVATSILVLGVASFVGDLARRRALHKAPFNVGQLSLSLGAAGATYQLAGGGSELGVRQLPAFGLAAVAFFIVNKGLVVIAIALAQGVSIRGNLRQDTGLEAWSSGMVFGMTPIVLLVAHDEPAFVPFLLLPIAAVYLATSAAIGANRRRAEAEEAARLAEEVAAEQRRLVVAEQALVRKLQEQDQLKDDLLATVSHEFRTPLTTILGSLSTVRRRSDALSEEQRDELMTIAERQGERLRCLIEELLQAARVGNAGIEQQGRPVIDAAAVAAEVARRARLAHPGRVIHMEGAELLPVRAAPRAVQQVIDRLVDNAAKYSPASTPICIQAVREGDLVVIAVEDAGPGVPPGESDRIFDRFTQIDTGNARKPSGVGLGLYIARELARAECGELLLASTPEDGQGARFELRLPLAAE